MDTLKAIYTRRSIRKYTDRPVPEKEIDTMLRAGMQAPSAGNEQVWHFIIVKKPEILESIADISQSASMAKEAPMGILVCADINLEKYAGFWVQDCAAASQNILLAAHALGLGAVWVGLHPRERRVNAVRDLFRLKEHIIPFCFIPVGYRGEEKEPEIRFKKEKIHHNKW
jgi:nitroreductase